MVCKLVHVVVVVVLEPEPRCNVVSLVELCYELMWSLVCGKSLFSPLIVLVHGSQSLLLAILLKAPIACCCVPLLLLPVGRFWLWPLRLCIVLLLLVLSLVPDARLRLSLDVLV